MKNILIYTNSDNEFSEENKTLVKIQIDNSFSLGWKPEDILLFTNFPYEYNGIHAANVPSELDCKWDRTSNKIIVIDFLLKNELLEKDLYWYHDFDAYQDSPIEQSELKMEGFDLGITGYGYKEQCCGGSFFFTETAGDLFDLWCKETFKKIRTRADEKTMTDLVNSNRINRYKWLDITYNFGQRCPRLCYRKALKPLKVLHFHPNYWHSSARYNNIDIFMHGKNKYKIPMMTDRLIKIFNQHGIK